MLTVARRLTCNDHRWYVLNFRSLMDRTMTLFSSERCWPNPKIVQCHNDIVVSRSAVRNCVQIKKENPNQTLFLPCFAHINNNHTPNRLHPNIFLPALPAASAVLINNNVPAQKKKNHLVPPNTPPSSSRTRTTTKDHLLHSVQRPVPSTTSASVQADILEEGLGPLNGGLRRPRLLQSLLDVG